MIRSRYPDDGSLWIDDHRPLPFLLDPVVVPSHFVFFFEGGVSIYWGIQPMDIGCGSPQP